MSVRKYIWHVVGAISLLLTILLLVDRQATREDDNGDASPLATAGFEAGTAFFTLYHNGTPVGQIRTERARRKPAGFIYNIDTELRLTAMGQSIEIALELSARFDSLFGLETIEFSMESGPTSARGKAKVVGQELLIELETGGNTIEHRMAFDRNLVLSTLLGPRITADALKPGDTRMLSVFDPLTQAVRKTKITAVAYEEIRIVDRPVKTLKIRQETMGVVLNGWVDESGNMVRQELGLGLVAQLEPKAVARHNAANKAGRVDLISEVMIAVDAMPKSRKSLRKMSYRIDGLDAYSMPDNTPRQQWSSGLMTLSMEPLNSEVRFVKAPSIVSGGDILYHANHAEVRQIATEISRDADTIVRLVQNALRWFAANIKQEAVASLPSALETLRTRKGDCNEHAFLFAGLMRSLGIETRVIAGIAYLDDLNKFAYHAWNEVKIGDRFVSVDPTWRQFPSDLTHIALARGGLEAQAQLWSLMGRLSIAVVAGPSSKR